MASCKLQHETSWQSLYTWIHLKPYLTHEHCVFLQLVSQLQLIISRRSGGAGSFTLKACIIVFFQAFHPYSNGWISSILMGEIIQEC